MLLLVALTAMLTAVLTVVLAVVLVVVLAVVLAMVLSVLAEASGSTGRLESLEAMAHHALSHQDCRPQILATDSPTASLSDRPA